MSAGFVKLRRGIIEHLPERMTFEEYGIYVLIILNADHRTGVWRGCALALSKRVGKSERWCRYRLASLRAKGYILATPSTGRGRYTIKIVKYFEKRHPVSASTPEAARSCRFEQKKRHPVSPYQEVSTYKKKREEVNLPPYPPTGGTEIFFEWARQTVAVRMGRKKRLPNLDAYHGGMASDVVAFLHRRGFEARIVTVQ